MRTRDHLYRLWYQGFLICVGLDTDPKKIPQHLITENGGNEMKAVLSFNKQIIQATKDIVLGYKINSAFYEGYGAEGTELFDDTCSYVEFAAPERLLIKDMKRGDIGNTNVGYARHLKNADAMTINGYFGEEANEPFLSEEFKEKLIIVLAKTSNKGSAEFQDKMSEGRPIYLHMAKNVMDWGKYKNCAVVVGGTHPFHLLQVRSVIGPDGIILVPGIGAQGGDLKATIVYGTNKDGEGIIINMSRSVIYASKEKDFTEKAREEVIRMNNEIAEYLKLPKVRWEDVMAKFYEEETFKILAERNAIIKDDHFVYQAGQHGPAYVAKDKVSIGPLAIDEIGRMLADLMKDYEIDTVVVPAAGAIVLGHVVAKYLCHFKGKDVNSVYLEKNTENRDSFDYNKFIVTRGFEEYIKDKNVAVLEDITNSGDTIIKIICCVEKTGGKVTTVGVICNRGGITAENLGKNITLVNLSVLDLVKYEPGKGKCPLCDNNVPINTTFGHGKKYLAEKEKS
jgi:orotidine-5'-phosphate decarboxylase